MKGRRPTVRSRRRLVRKRLNRPDGHQRLARRPRRFQAAQVARDARRRLQRFRQGSILAISITSLLLILWGGAEPATAQETESAPEVLSDPLPDPSASLEQATSTIRELLMAFYSFLPKLLISLVLLGLAALAARAIRSLLQRLLGNWSRTAAISALARIVLYLAAVVAALGIMAGDARASLGSIGLVGLALSWALQTPIESFTGWLLNSFQSYYRVGDRIEVGDVFGDVYKVDVLTTTVWEAGGPGKSVSGAQATGALITFPNWEVLRSNIVNYSRDFPYIWDEVTVGLANESDLAYSIQVIESVADRVVGTLMAEPAARYREILERARLAFDVDEKPRAFLSQADAWTNCTIRYLVPVRTRRRWSTDLILALSKELSRPEHRGKIIAGYPRTQVDFRQGLPTDRPQPPHA